MGTWGYGIKENDTSFDVIETFYEKYNEGMKPEAVKDLIHEHFSYELQDFEDSDNVLFPLAQCLWETCALDGKTLAKVRERIEGGGNIEVLKGLAADDDFLKERSIVLEKFISKISTPKEKPKARKKPPVRIE